MRSSKRLLAILLAIILAVGIGSISAAAAPSGDPAMPVITVHPQSLTMRESQNGGASFSVQAHIPNGDPIGYLWVIATPDGEELLSGLSLGTINMVGMTTDYWLDGREVCCVVYNAADSSETEGPHRVESQRASVTVEPAPGLPVITSASWDGWRKDSWLSQDLEMRQGSEFTLSIQAHAPNGDGIRYQWFSGENPLEGEIGPSLTQKAIFSKPSQILFYSVRVYNAMDDSLFRYAGVAIRQEATPIESFLMRSVFLSWLWNLVIRIFY